MKKLLLLFVISLALLPAGYSKVNYLILVGSYNIRYDNPHDGINVWANRKEHVKALIQFHEWDIFGTQEAMINQVKDIAELQQYACYGKGRDDVREAGEHCAIFYKKDRFKLLVSGDFWLSERTRSHRIHYIFVNDQINVLKYGVLTDFYGHQSYPSDHFPIVAKVIIN